MPDIATAIADLNAALSDARHEENSLSAQSRAVQEQLILIQRAAFSLQEAQLQAQSVQLELSQTNTAATTAISDYFSAIADLRTAVEAGGELSVGSHNQLIDDVKTALGVADAGAVHTLRAEVTGYDTKNSSRLSDLLDTEIPAAEAAYAASRAASDLAKEAFENCDRNVHALVNAAFASHKRAVQAIKRIETAIEAGDNFSAVVHLEDLIAERIIIWGDVQIDKDEAVQQFNVDQSDAASLEAQIRGQWESKRDAYEAAAADLAAKTISLQEKRIELAALRAEDLVRGETRLVDAAQLVADKHATL